MAHKEPRVECKIYLRPEERDHLKEVAKEKEVSLSDLIKTTVLKKYPMKKRKQPTESPTPELTREQVQKRLTEIDEYIKAHKGTIPKPEFYRLKAEQAELQEWKEN